MHRRPPAQVGRRGDANGSSGIGEKRRTAMPRGSRTMRRHVSHQFVPIDEAISVRVSANWPNFAASNTYIHTCKGEININTRQSCYLLTSAMMNKK